MTHMTSILHSTVAATAVGPHLFWITSRAAGIAALLLSSLAVCVGPADGRTHVQGPPADLRVTHEALSLATLAALAVHGLTLIGDSFLHPTLDRNRGPLRSALQDALDQHRDHRVLGDG